MDLFKAAPKDKDDAVTQGERVSQVAIAGRDNDFVQEKVRMAMRMEYGRNKHNRTCVKHGDKNKQNDVDDDDDPNNPEKEEATASRELVAERTISSNKNINSNNNNEFLQEKLRIARRTRNTGNSHLEASTQDNHQQVLSDDDVVRLAQGSNTSQFLDERISIATRSRQARSDHVNKISNNNENNKSLPVSPDWQATSTTANTSEVLNEKIRIITRKRQARQENCIGTDRTSCDEVIHELESEDVPEQQEEQEEQDEEDGVDVNTRAVIEDAYVVDEAMKEQHQRQRELELAKVHKEKVFQEIVLQIPHAEELSPEEILMQNQRRQDVMLRQKRQRRRSKLVQSFATLTIIGSVIVAVVLLFRQDNKHNNNDHRKSREEQLNDLLLSISDNVLLNESSPQYEAFHWLLHDDPLQLNVVDSNSMSGQNAKIVERFVLVLLFLMTGGKSSWTNTFGFLFNSSTCQWQGIACNPSGFVNGIYIAENNLHGRFPVELSALQDLEYIDFRFNHLYGTIPSSLRSNRRLEKISLYNNDLTGTIPDLSNLANQLRSFGVRWNRLSGTLPHWLTSAPHLEWLNLRGNYLSGSVPSFASQNNLEYVDLSYNLFHGSLPPSIGRLPILEWLYLEYNMFSGTLPEAIGQLKNVKELSAYVNSLSGLPTAIGLLESVEYLDFEDNELVGTIPTEMGYLTSLVELWLSKNRLSGTIPSEVAALEELAYLYLYNNSLTGDVSALCTNGAAPAAAEGEGGINQSIGFGRLYSFEADCGNSSQAEVICPCCTKCCNDATGCGTSSAEDDLEEQCLELASILEESTLEEQGTVCQCLDDGQKVSCRDMDCMYCKQDGSICYIDADSGIIIGVGGSYSYAVALQYVRGRDEHVSLEYDYITETDVEQCAATINGMYCNSCDVGYHCSDG